MGEITFDVERFKKDFNKSDAVIEQTEKILGCSLKDFFNHYCDNIHPKLKELNNSIMQDFFMPLMNPDIDLHVSDSNTMHINSIKSRVKDPYHFIDKLVRKVNKSTEYAGITLDNCHLFFDDLIGFRVILLYLEDWYQLYEELVELFPYSEKDVKGKKERENISEEKAPFMISKPEINIRNGDDEDVYRRYFEDGSFERKFDLKKGRYYRSIHYSVFFKGYCFEIQVRSLFDEAWSEVDHDVLYPLYLENRSLVEYSKQMNRVAGLGNEMASYFRSVLKGMATEIDSDKECSTSTLSVVPNELVLGSRLFDRNLSENKISGDNNSVDSVLDNIIKGE